MSLKSFDKNLFIICLLSFIFIIVSRAPTLLDEFGPLGFKLNINAGYFVVFSVPVMFVSMLLLWVTRDKNVQNQVPYSNNRWIIPILLIFPSVASLVMLAQFVFMFAPTVKECNTFDRARMFWDLSLFEMKPDYCIDLPEATQDLMPYIYPPVQSWIYVILFSGTVFLTIKLVQYVKS